MAEPTYSWPIGLQRASAVVALVVLVLAGCTDPPEPAEPINPPSAAGQPTPSSIDEVSAHDGQFCPEVLPPAQQDHGFGTDQPADSAPSLLSPEAAWVCRYDPRDTVAEPPSDGAVFEWVRAGGPSGVSSVLLPDLERELANLVPAALHQACDDDLGSRFMLVYTHDLDLTGVVVDDYGCRSVRLTDEPFETAPGEATTEGVVPGALAPNAALLRQLKDLHTSVPFAPVQFGPAGAGGLRLGMTRAEVAATGVATTQPGSRHDGWRRGCFLVEYRRDRLGWTPGETLNGALSTEQGLEKLSATYAMVTPQGVRVGSPIEEVRRAYDRPRLKPGKQLVIRASLRTVYRIQVSEVVTMMQLELRRLDCEI